MQSPPSTPVAPVAATSPQVVESAIRQSGSNQEEHQPGPPPPSQNLVDEPVDTTVLPLGQHRSVSDLLPAQPWASHQQGATSPDDTEPQKHERLDDDLATVSFTSVAEARASPPKVESICNEVIGELFPRSGTKVWKDTAIFELKSIFEFQQSIVSRVGLYHTQALSTSLVLQAVTDLISNGPTFFAHHSNHTPIQLELHLRCIAAGLRLLCVHGMEERTGGLSKKSFESLYNHMNWWRTFHLDQLAFDKKRGEHKKALNYNNEFLIVYIRDMICSIPVEQTMAANVAKRMLFTAGYLYSKKFQEAATALKGAIQLTSTPSSWHAKYRTMDDLCHSVRVLQESIQKGSSPEKIDQDLIRDTEQAIAGQLIEILKEELNGDMSAFHGDKVGAAIRMANDTAGLAPVARKGHFVYGLLDLLQFHACAMLSGKFDKAIVELMIQVVQVSEYSFLRCKAFEVLAKFSVKHGVGQLPIDSVNELLERRNLWPSAAAREKVSEQWRVLKTKALVEDPHYLTRLKQNLPDRALVVDFDEPIVSVHAILMAKEAQYKKKEAEFDRRYREVIKRHEDLRRELNRERQQVKDLTDENETEKRRFAQQLDTVERQLHDVSKAYEAQSQTCKTQEATLQKLRSEMKHLYDLSEAFTAEMISRFEALKPQERETVD